MSPVKSAFKSVVKKVISQEQSLFYRSHNHCSLCGHELEVSTRPSPNESKIVETISCPSCRVTIRNQEHSIC